MSELLEAALESLIDTDPVLKQLQADGQTRRARLAAVCKPIFRNLIEKSNPLQIRPFSTVKKRLGE